MKKLKIKSIEKVGSYWIAESNYSEYFKFSVHECEPDLFNIKSQHPQRFKTKAQALKFIKSDK